MAENIETKEDQILRAIGLELMFSTPQSRENSDGVTAVELSRKLGYNMDIVKKKLKILYDKGIIRCIGINPKLWKFDDYNFQRMDETDPIFILLCTFDDVDFSKFFYF